MASLLMAVPSQVVKLDTRVNMYVRKRLLSLVLNLTTSTTKKKNKETKVKKKY